jgi:hypothetical protein
LQARTIMTTAAVILLSVTGGVTGGVSAQAPLRYKGMPAKVVFTTADTVASTINGGPMGAMVTTIGSTSILSLELHAVGDSTHVVSTLTEMKGTMEAMGQSMEIPIPPTAKEPAEFMLAQNGETRHVKGTGAPDIARGAAPSGAISRMFIKLPEKSLSIGDTWTDTTNEKMDTAGIKMAMTGTTRGTYASDSTVDGVRVKVIRFAGESTMKMSGNMNGMEMSQDVKGTSSALALFDPARNIVIFIREEAKMEGKLDAPAANMSAVPITQEIRRTLRLSK